MCPEIRVEECTPTKARLIIGPLERGYGVTIGNALRRVLLSSIKGAGVTAVRVEGALHEFTTLPGVREDIIELQLNLKHIPVRSHSVEVRVLRLEATGPKKVTVADIQPDSEIEFIDPNFYICTLAEGHSISMELYIEQGVGYATADRPRPDYLPVDALMVDPNFAPISRVKYDVQAERVGHKTDYEKVVMDIYSNGVIAPDMAVAEAAKLLREYFSIVVKEILKRYPASAEMAASPVEMEQEQPSLGQAIVHSDDGAENSLLGHGVRDLELSIRSENCLLRGGIYTIGELVSRSKEELLKIRNLRKISLREIEEKMAKYNLSLADDKGTSEEKLGKED